MANTPAKPATKPTTPSTPKPTTPPPPPKKDPDDLGDGIGVASDSKGEKRLFQRGDDPSRKEWLTKAEAEKHGLYWATAEEINQRQGGIRGST